MVVDEYSTECDICGIYNVKIICPSCAIKFLEPLNELINEVEKHDSEGVQCLIEVRDEIVKNIKKVDW